MLPLTESLPEGVVKKTLVTREQKIYNIGRRIFKKWISFTTLRPWNSTALMKAFRPYFSWDSMFFCNKFFLSLSTRMFWKDVLKTCESCSPVGMVIIFVAWTWFMSQTEMENEVDAVINNTAESYWYIFFKWEAFCFGRTAGLWNEPDFA